MRLSHSAECSKRIFHRRGCDRERHLHILPSSPSQSLLRKSSSPKGRAKSTAGRGHNKKASHISVRCFFLVEITGIEPVTSCMPCKRSPERYRNTPPTRKCGDRLNIALIRSIHQKGSQLHPASRNHAPPTRQFYHPIFKCVNGFCSERRSFTRKVFSDSLLSAILILHIKVALFIFPKSIDKEVFSTMPIYYRCFLSMNQPHDP